MNPLLVLLISISIKAVSSGIIVDPTPDPLRASLNIAVKQPDTPLHVLAQNTINEKCRRRCRSEVCYIPDDADCRNFVTCTRDFNSTLYLATIQPCAFGTYWAGYQSQKKITCDIPQNVVCKRDYCADKAIGSTYSHSVMSCRLYWMCADAGVPMPFCCPEGDYYDVTSGMCKPDTLGECKYRCPIKQDACMLGQATEFFDDNNCKTYWDCEDRQPHPVCCEDNHGYDIHVGRCVRNGCNATCPEQYRTDRCTAVDKYSLLDGLCRTYMKCNAIKGDERWCCQSQHVFDPASQSCVRVTPDMQLPCGDVCPMGYREECHLKPGSTPDTFLMPEHNRMLELKCAPGTIFNQNDCVCGDPSNVAADNACSMELDIMFDRPAWVRTGAQRNTEIATIGIVEDGPALGGRTSYMYNGRLTFRDLFFKQPLPNLYINLYYLPETGSVGSRQVLLSNCQNTQLGAPTLDLYLQDGKVMLAIVTDPVGNGTQARSVVATASYTVGVWNNLRAIYNGQDLSLLNEGSGDPTYDQKKVEGIISVASEGLDIGGCIIGNDLRDGFVGSMGQLQFSKCLKRAWVDDFNQATSGFQSPPP